MNVLLITYSFPPAAGVGVLRALSLAKYLPESGVTVDVLTARNAAAVGQDAGLLAQVPPGVRIHRTFTPDLPFALRKAIKKLISRPAKAAAASAQSAAVSQPGRPNALKQMVGNLLLPDPQVGWVPFALRAVKRIIRERKIDVVLITVPPFSSVKLATRLRQLFPALPIVVDFRDEWLSSTIHLVSFNANAKAREVASRTEAEAVRDATAVVCVTEAATGELKRRYPREAAAKFLTIPNGYDTPAPTAPSVAAVDLMQPVTLTYIGTVYGSTDPASVVEAILSLPPAVRSRLRVRFIGHIETAAYRATLERLNGSGVELQLIGFLPQAQALAYIRQTDYLLLITHDPINVAAKLYDYIGSARPILAAVHPTGDVQRILAATRAGWSASIEQPDAIATMLSEAVERAPRLAEEYRPDLAAIGTYHRRPIAARYAEMLRELVGAKVAR